MNFDELEAAIETNRDDNDELARLYLAMNDAAAQISALKKIALEHLEANLRNAGFDRGECDIATYGITDPAPHAKVDEKAWDAAVADSIELTQLEIEYNKARAPYLIDATQDPRPYVRKKRGV